MFPAPMRFCGAGPAFESISNIYFLRPVPPRRLGVLNDGCKDVFDLILPT